MQTAKLLAFLSFLIAPAIAHAAECDNKPGYYVNGSGACVECANAGYYCPGDGTRAACPPISGREDMKWPAEYPNFTQAQPVIFYGETATASSITNCIARYRITDGRAVMIYHQRYNPDTDKYDVAAAETWWSWPNAGYYLTSLRQCPTGASWNNVSLCDAGGYCPGETSHWLCANGKSPENYGLYGCGDNT